MYIGKYVGAYVCVRVRDLFTMGVRVSDLSKLVD